ncbi:NRDE-2, necessary for RNA interference-domain-containing protein [Pisolithus croceorrhizus]|nr:NRDE-2, necessary for RNA interference-domain-containing protein [Pisolithus croceorrhizus]
MSAPSFPSFTPSFSSFPDLPDPGPSKRTTSSPDPANVQRDHPDEAYQRNKIDRNNWRDRKVDKEKKYRREKHIPHIPETTRHSSWVKDIVFHDERNKQDEDRRLAAQDHTQWSFFSDRKGDPLNITYGGIHAGDLPKYRPVNQGRYILGLVGNWSVSRKSGKGIEIVLGGNRKQLGLTDSGTRTLLNAPARRLTASASNHRYEEVNGFLPLPSRVGRVAGEVYGSLQDEADTDSESSEGQEDNSDEDEGPLALPSDQLAIKELEQKIALQPSSVESWLSLVTRSLATVPPTSKNASTVRAEITLSILDRALTAHPANRTSRRLRLIYLRAGEDVWYESKLQVEWEEALKLGGVEIWMEWLEWRIRKSTESIDSVVTDATRALQALGGSSDSEVDKLRVVWRVAVVFQEAALFQAQAELTFEVPQSLYGLPIETQLEALEEFWESEAPRVGELGAKGWSAWTSSGRPEIIRADRLLRAPTRSTTERAVSDPYSTVLFSDIRPLLLPLTTQRAKSIFRLMWLALLGLHIPGFSRSLAGDAWDRWSYTFFTSPACLSSIFPEGGFARQFLADSYSGILIGKEREYSSAFGPIKEWSLNVIGPLEWVGKDQWRMWTAEKAIFSQLRCGTEDHEWDIYALAFEAATSVKALSRSFLSTARESLAHWAAHARLERLRGRIEDARKVYQTVLIAVRRPPTHGFVGQLWWDWAEMEWLSGDQELALRVVMRAGNVDGSGGVMVLRAKRNLEDIINASHERWKDREAWIKLRAVIELLAASSPASALAIFDTQPASGSRTSTEQQESLTVASLLMLYNHSSTLRNPTPPAFLRDRLQAALETYPSNTIILGMFLEAEKGYGLWGRVRNQMSQVNKDKDITRRVAEVWMAGWEKGRWEREIERTRAGLFAAAESERTKNSSTIWRIIMEFEIRAGQMQRAKDLLYRAVSECPLSKELYLLAFGPLRPVFKPHELHGFVEVMADRGLRMRRSLEEYTRNYREVRESDNLRGDPEASDDEIERDARERRRLMPY